MKKIIAAIVCGSLLVMSCKKEKTSPASETYIGFKKLKEFSSYYNGSLNNSDVYTYDSEGRIATYTSSKEIHMFTYTGNDQLKVTAKNKATGEIKWVHTAKLNGRGAITEISKRNPAGVLADAYSYSYDANGYMISYKYVQPLYDNDVQERFFVNENGNVVSAKSYHNGVHLNNYFYEYDLGEVNRVPHTADFNWISETLFGKPNKNPRKSMRIVKVADGALSFHALYSRSYNSEQNILEEKVEYPILGASGSFQYRF